jgi:hypothetical protein
VAVGLDGREHSTDYWSKGGAAEFEQITATFSRMPLKDIKTFRLQIRPYRWVEFRNVSLQPGKKTDVKVGQLKTADPPISPGLAGSAQVELLEGPDVLVLRGKREDVHRIGDALTRGQRAAGRAQIELLEGLDVLVLRGKREDVHRIGDALTRVQRAEEAAPTGKNEPLLREQRDTLRRKKVDEQKAKGSQGFPHDIERGMKADEVERIQKIMERIRENGGLPPIEPKSER